MANVIITPGRNYIWFISSSFEFLWTRHCLVFFFPHWPFKNGGPIQEPQMVKYIEGKITPVVWKPGKAGVIILPLLILA